MADATGKNQFDTLESLYYYLTPADLSTPKTEKMVNIVTAYDILHKMSLDPKGAFYGWERIVNEIENHFKKTNDKEQRKLLGDQFHAISADGTLNLGDKENYWGSCSLGSICPELSVDSIKKRGMKNVSIFTTNNPTLSPAMKGTDAIDFFLNYIPPVVFSQIVPYLDVELEIISPPYENNGQNFENLSGTSTPSMMRFLLGTTRNFNKFDRSIYSADFDIQNKKNGEVSEIQRTAYSGMEMFLAPQTLTNMDGLAEDSNSRLVRAKPFLPLSTIEGLDVSIANAGAGSFSHKKGTLKIKLHDKSRISEFSEFIRGGGVSTVLIWTTYGWLAPMGRHNSGNSNPGDAYSEFINGNMLIRDCWQPVNTQFSFDAAGQVSFSIELVSKATRHLQALNMASTLGDQGLHQSYQELNEVMKFIGQVKTKFENNPKFSITTSASEVLNSASSTGNFTDMKNVKDMPNVIKGLLNSVRNTSLLSKDEVKKLETCLDKLTKNNGESLYELSKKKSSTMVQEKFSKLSTSSPDPFLNNNLIPSGLKENIQKFTETKSYEKYQNQIRDNIKESKIPIIKLNSPKAAVVSFGKLFINFVLPAMVASNLSKEFQVFFYGFNDQCGPMSNLSIAEFPINTLTLAYAYAESLKNLRTDVLTLEQFMRLVIDTQFTDLSSIGYGMHHLYKAPRPDNLQRELNKDDSNTEIELSKWTQKYGSLKMPIIEIFIESGEEDSIPGGKEVVQNLKSNIKNIGKIDPSKNIITRIHIYDKQSNPHKLMQQIIDSGNDTVELGEINMAKVRSKIEEQIKSLNLKQAEQINSNLENSKDPASTKDFINFIERPSGQTVRFPRNRKRFKSELMKYVPKIMVGSNGSLVTNASVASKTDGLMGAINIRNAYMGVQGKSSTSNNSLEDPGHLPLRTHPVSINITSAGVPTASLYQTFFIDFDTGTSIDNIYNCTQIQHNIAPGKFTTSWVFNPSSNGYGKFSSPQSLSQVVTGEYKRMLKEYIEKLANEKKPGKK